MFYVIKKFENKMITYLKVTCFLSIYHKIANTSRFEAHEGFFRLLMNVPFGQKVDFLISNPH